MGLTKEQVARYSRQLLLPELGVVGQERLLNSSVLIVGTGGLGSPAALYLAAAGVGTIGIMDRDTVALSNLHRQIVHTTQDVGRPKSESASTRLHALNPELAIRPIQDSLDETNVTPHVQEYDLVLDGSDNFPTRYLVNDACVLTGTPLIHGGVIRLQGQVLMVRPRQGACLRCVFPEPPQGHDVPSCQEAGVLGAVAGIIGSLMAHEAIKWLTGIGEPLTNRLLIFDGPHSRFRDVAVRRDPACAVCGDRPSIQKPHLMAEVMCVDRLTGRPHG